MATATTTLSIASTAGRRGFALATECSFKHARLYSILNPLKELFLIHPSVHICATRDPTTFPLATTLLCHIGISMKAWLVGVRRASHSLEQKTEIFMSNHLAWSTSKYIRSCKSLLCLLNIVDNSIGHLRFEETCIVTLYCLL
jgi:hypothetical protein